MWPLQLFNSLESLELWAVLLWESVGLISFHSYAKHSFS